MKTGLIAIALLLASPAYPADHQRDASRELVQQFAAQLQTELKSAMEAGGPTNAIHVCRDRAPAIAAALSRESGAKIGRTSLRLRNPANLHEPWQYPVLLRFDELSGDEIASKGEHFEAKAAPGIAARYMKAIPTQPLCLACHGNPAGEVADALASAYPHDRATGYAAGAVRGAFFVVWPEAGPEEGTAD